ncbi:hypothetical protein Nepgr_027514 [Nepenthes gracilis]|uniref:Uncharacterized protein n=1 Tax=Nepenthes gracilis TaxID=150966 RepID=A0AAD3TBH7_NEPGR|nr:hypothetical protein Nepgr_027514 [Nepenthes gracilis]
MAMQRRAHQLATLKSENENLKCLNARILRELHEMKQEANALRASKMSLESELARSHSEAESLKTELAQLKDEALKEIENAGRELEALRRDVSEARRKSFWTMACSGTAILTAAASLAYFLRSR